MKMVDYLHMILMSLNKMLILQITEKKQQGGIYRGERISHYNQNKANWRQIITRTWMDYHFNGN
jgi:uncharacterized membrane protein